MRIQLNDLNNCEYLGDGVYTGFDNYGILWLITHNGILTENEICLEGTTLAAFKSYLEALENKNSDIEQFYEK